MLNTQDHVTPNHWSVSRFERWAKMEPQKEFELISVVLAFFVADVMLKSKAMRAWNKLKLAGHPVAWLMTARAMSELRIVPEGIQERYNALFMYLVDSAEPEAEFVIDEWGAFEVRLPWGDVFSGDAYGQFPLYLDATALTRRIALFEGDAVAMA
jgi:hypothetical protein